MRLNPDCTRDLLMLFEEKTEPYSCLSYSPREISEELPKYSAKEIAYHVSQCAASGMFIGYQGDLSGNFIIRDISPKAHEFLANIREDTVWNKTKGIAKDVGSNSLNALCQIASSVITSVIQSKLGL